MVVFDTGTIVRIKNMSECRENNVGIVLDMEKYFGTTAEICHYNAISNSVYLHKSELGEEYDDEILDFIWDVEWLELAVPDCVPEDFNPDVLQSIL